jgi:thioredoxin 1
MKTPMKMVVLAALAVAVAGAVALNRSKAKPEPGTAGGKATASVPGSPPAAKGPAAAQLPRLLDLGSTKCIPCKMMAPILEELKKEYAGRFEVEFMDVVQDPEMGKQLGVDIIPTQIFYDASGKELFRHVGFFGKEDVLGKWKELGVNTAAK